MAVIAKAEVTISDIIDGIDGKGITSTVITYQAGTSGTTAPIGTWSAAIPYVSPGQYLWSRTVITYTEGNPSTTYSVSYIPKNGTDGATGSQGPTGTGIDSITQQYYLSTSKTTQTGGLWVTSMPTWSTGMYLWTRYLITYKNPTSTAYTSPVCDSSWEAVNEVQKDLTSNYYNKVETDSKFDIQKDSIISTVTKETTTLINNIEIGGRNLILNSSFSSKENSGIYTFNGEEVTFSTDTPTNGSNNQYSFYNKTSDYFIKNARGKTITLSMEYYIEEEITYGTTNPWIGFELGIYRNNTTGGSSQYLSWYGNKTFPTSVTDKWTRYSTSVDVKDYDIASTQVAFIMRDASGTVKFRHPKIELGNKATDWTPAPEDMATADSLADVNNSLTDVTNDLQNSINATNQNLQDVQNNQNEVYQIISENKTQISSLVQRAEGFTMDFKTVNETVKQINDQFVTERDERYKYIKFIDGEIWLGKEVPIGEDDFKLVIKNDRISFLQNKVEVAYMSNNKLYVTDIHVTNSLQLGYFIQSTRSNGNVGIRWVNQ